MADKIPSIPEGSRKNVPSSLEIPHGPRKIVISPGHIPKLADAGFVISENDLYFTPGSISPYASIDIDKFLNDQRLKENPTIEIPDLFSKEEKIKINLQNAFFNVLLNEIGQTNAQMLALNELYIEGDEKNPKKRSSTLKTLEIMDKIITTGHYQAVATQALLNEIEGPDSRERQVTQERVDRILKDEKGNTLSLDSKLETASKTAKEIKEKLS